MKCFNKKNNKKLEMNNQIIKKQDYINYLNLLIENLNQRCILIQNQIIVLANKCKTIPNENLTCSICMENHINCAFIPCGHTFCKECIIKNISLNKNNCFMCRKNVINYLPIYL